MIMCAIECMISNMTNVNIVCGTCVQYFFFFFFSSRRRHTRLTCDWSSDVCSSDLFKGTKNRPTTQIITREIDRLGASTNAYTDTEEVAYYAEGPARAMDQLAEDRKSVV